MAKANALVSIVIPAYNAEGSVNRAIDSILAQTYDNIEIIVVDDGSSDGTETVCRVYGERIRFIKQNNQGASAARNTGIREAAGTYIGFLDADDWYMSEKIEHNLKLFLKFPSCGAVTSRFTQRTVSGDLETPQAGRILADGITEGIIDYFQSETQGNWVVHTNTILLKKGVLDTVGLFNVSLKYGEDVDLWCRIAGRFDIAFQEKALAVYDRTNEASLCSSVSVLEQGVGYLYGRQEIARYISADKQVSYMEFRNTILLARLMLSIYERERGRLLACLRKLYPFPVNARIALALFCLPLPCVLWPRNLKRQRNLKK